MDVFQVNNEVTFKNISPFYQGLLEGIEKHQEVTLDFGGSSRLDFSVIQVIIAAQKYARDAMKTIRIRNLKGVVRDQLKLCKIIR